MEANTPKGKAILKQAFAGEKTLSFKRQEDGTLIVTDVTEHLSRLEELVDEHNLEYENE